MFPNIVRPIYSDGQQRYQHLEQVIYLSKYHCSFCAQQLVGVVDDFVDLSTGQKLSLCNSCKGKLNLVQENSEFCLKNN